MDYTFSTRISSLQPSAIREILKVTADPSVISFAAGNPSPETFPADEMASLAAEIFANNAASALQYGVSEGYTPLREVTSSRIRERYGVGQDSDDLIIVSGGQQGIELSAKTLVNEGDTILCENPSFIGALNALRSYGVRLTGVKCGTDGMDMDDLEEKLKTEPNVRLIYTIPTFQNPTGATMPLGNRRKLLELSGRYNVLILEDDPYRELRYDGQTVPAIKSMDDANRVIYCGSYSKVIAPGIRLGYVCAPKPLISKITVAKQVSDVHSNLFFQMLVNEYLRRYDLDKHLDGARKLYRQKRDCMVSALRENCAGLDFTVPEGGLFIWAELRGGLDGFELCRLAGTRKVAAVPGSSFLVDETEKSPAVRLNFSLPGLEQIVKGCALLGEAVNEYCGG